MNGSALHDSILNKPFTLDNLRGAIAKLLSN
jgi:hypothetical protein